MIYRATGFCANGPFDLEVEGDSPADAFVEVSLSVPGEAVVSTLANSAGDDVLSTIDPRDPVL